MSERPAYAVPSMAEIAALPWNGYRVASLFAGGGGSSTGYRMAGFRVLYANEFVESAAETYRANAGPHTVVDTRDVRIVTGQEILEAAGVERGELDVLDGSPPCASFSTAGRRSEKWGKVSEYSETRQRTDDLFMEYARIVGEVQPKVFVAENVSGLVKGVAKGYFKMILRELRAQGYRVAAKVLNAADLGVPQARQRVIFIGVRDDLDLEPVYPKPFGYRYALADVLPHVAMQGAGTSGAGWGGKPNFVKSDEPSRTIGASTHTGSGVAPSSYVVEKAIRTGRYSMRDMAQSVFPTVTASGVAGVSRREYVLVVGEDGSGDSELRCPETEQRLMLTQENQAKRAMPHLDIRKLSIPEVRVLCSFPADFVLVGSYNQRWERMGRSVPPLMMKAIAESVRDGVLAKCAG